ncbi:four helix bundle protein [uncultured Microscilla sp.]|uniref:four helix bundle protein n=1 Tax=uncultured Microscilla sp. TaxID=432653 RepID=UPI002637A421|nr:four helix bundle protein [uncultured Microscilla sp.]
MRDFKKLNIWAESISLAKKVYQLSTLLPIDEKFGLNTQVKRGVVSIASNIAEGSSRDSELEFKRYLEISLGACFELETQLILMKELNLLSVNNLEASLNQVVKLQKMLGSFIKSIKARIKDIHK